MVNKLRNKLHDPLVVGTHATMSDPIVSQILGYVGFDFLWIDTEHTPMDYSVLQGLLDGASLSGISSVVRVPVFDPSHVKRVVDMGPDGIIFPMVNTRQEADAMMDLCLYPPHGTRGFGPARAIRYSFDSIPEYIKDHEKRLVRMIQIESETAVKNLPEIIQNPYIDVYIIGPNDMAGSIGEMGNPTGENTVALIKETISILKAANKPIGISTYSTDPEVLKYWLGMGVNIISSGVDYEYIIHGAQSNLSTIQELGK